MSTITQIYYEVDNDSIYWFTIDDIKRQHSLIALYEDCDMIKFTNADIIIFDPKTDIMIKDDELYYDPSIRGISYLPMRYIDPDTSFNAISDIDELAAKLEVLTEQVDQITSFLSKKTATLPAASATITN